VRNLVIPLLVCIACAVVVSITAVVVRAEQIANVENEKKNKIISAAGIEIAEDEVENEFKKIATLYVDFRSNEFVSVEEKYDHLKAVLKPELSEIVPKDKDIAILKRRENIGPIYVWANEDKEVERVVLPIRGYGLWGTLYGYLSLGSDLNSVNGIEFYDHKETPGLGGEVENEDWKAIWKGKLIYNQDGGVELRVVKGVAKDEYQIDGLSGATLTSNGVSNMINYWLGDEAYGPALNKLKEHVKNS
tara:strand:- start:452 stop:1192 length:741 start_codon:yes stop_codon:yes gene_type:complete